MTLMKVHMVSIEPLDKALINALKPTVTNIDTRTPLPALATRAASSGSIKVFFFKGTAIGRYSSREVAFRTRS